MALENGRRKRNKYKDKMSVKCPGELKYQRPKKHPSNIHRNYRRRIERLRERERIRVCKLDEVEKSWDRLGLHRFGESPRPPRDNSKARWVYHSQRCRGRADGNKIGAHQK